jgi:hypothetical protein
VYDARLKLACRNEFDRRSISAEVRRDAYEGLRTDSDAPSFERDLPFAVDLFSFRGADGLTEVTAALLFPGEALSLRSFADAGVAYALDLTLIVADTAAGRVTRVDTTATARAARPLGDGELLRTHLSLSSTPTGSAVQRVIAREHDSPAHGRMVGGPFEVMDFTGDTLMVSDVVLASTAPDGPFRRGDVALTLVPTREFPGGAFRAYYEVYGLSGGDVYSTELRIDRVRGAVGRAVHGLFGSGSAIRLRFTDEAAPDETGAQKEVRRIETALDEGRYRMTVTLTRDGATRSVTREREFTVVR